MASGKTVNYGLSQWEATDQVVRADFNADNEKIDAGIKEAKDTADSAQEAADAANTKAEAAYSPGNSPYVIGWYTGNGATTQTISLGFAPRAVLVFRTELVSTQWETGAFFGIATVDCSIASGSNIVLKVTNTGFVAGMYSSSSTTYGPRLNVDDATYVYIAMR